MASGLDFSSF
jgi:hypothetical protein